MDELSGESMNVRNRLDGVERRLGLEVQQQQASLRDLQSAIDQCRGDVQELAQGFAEVQTEIQSRDQKHFELEESSFRLNVDLEKGLGGCREGPQRAQHTPESGSVSASAHQEHVKAVQQALDECRARLTTHEKKFQDGERQMRRLHDEVRAQNQQPKPEVPMGLPSEVQAARLRRRFKGIKGSIHNGKETA